MYSHGTGIESGVPIELIKYAHSSAKECLLDSQKVVGLTPTVRTIATRSEWLGTCFTRKD